MTLNFTETEIPDNNGRAKMTNPFVENKVFPRDDKAIALTFDGLEDGPKDDDNAVNIRRHVKWAQEAAKAVDRTCRYTSKVGGTKTKPTTTLSFWTVPRITRKRKDASAENENAGE